MTGDAEPRVLWPEATERLLEDPAFRPVVERVGPVVHRWPPGGPLTRFQALTRSIVYQQLAGKAAATIHGRVVEALEGDVTAERVLAVEEETLRGAGLSRAKAAAIRDLASRVASGDVSLDDLDHLDDDAVVARLTRVRGIGRWTAEMFLLFTLLRPDVWPVTDLGVRSGMARLLGWEAPPSPRELELIGVGYRPWRSAAAWYCWRAVDTEVPGE